MVQWLNYLLLSSPSNYHELGTMVIIKRSWKQSHPGWMLPRVLPGPALPRTETLELFDALTFLPVGIKPVLPPFAIQFIYTIEISIFLVFF